MQGEGKKENGLRNKPKKVKDQGKPPSNTEVNLEDNSNWNKNKCKERKSQNKREETIINCEFKKEKIQQRNHKVRGTTK
jgi:hypothetical protein